MTIEVITCEKVMGVVDVTTLYPRLLTVLLEEKQVSFDCSQVERIEMAALQMLYAFSKAATLYGNDVSWNSPSHAFIKANQLLGVADMMAMTELTNTYAPPSDVLEHEQRLLPRWDITYRPDVDCQQRVTDPVDIFQSLAVMGKLTVEVDDDKLPPFSELEPTNCYLAWQLTLEGKNDQQAVAAVFGEMRGQSELEITPSRLTHLSQSDDVQVEIKEMLVEEEPEQNNEQASVRAIEAKIQHEIPPTTEVDTMKVGDLLELVGEFVVAQSAISELANNFTPDLLPKLNESIEQLQGYTREMHTTVMQMSMRPVGSAFEHLPTLVTTLSQTVGKKVEIACSGEQVEVDKAALEKVAAALSSLVTQTINHSFETPEQRQAAGKSEAGRLQLNAYPQADQIVIEISDDGEGLNATKIRQKAIESGLVSSTESLSEQAIYKLIFIPGFSMSDNPDSLGLEAAMDNIQALGGSISVVSRQGEGTSYTLRLPLASTIIDGQVITVSGQQYVLPLTAIIESFEFDTAQIKQISGKGELYPFENDYIPILRLYQLFNQAPTTKGLEQGLLMIVEEKGQKVGLFVDDILFQQQVVVKDLATHYRQVLGFAGATILCHGKVALILDIPGLIKLYKTPSLARVYMSEQGTIAP